MMNKKFKQWGIGLLIAIVVLAVGIIGTLGYQNTKEKQEVQLTIPTIFQTKATATYQATGVVGTTAAINKIVTDPIYNQMTITSVDCKNTAICQLVSYLVGNKRYVLLVPTGTGRTTVRVTGQYNKKTYGYDIQVKVTNPDHVKVGVDLSSYQGKIEAEIGRAHV